MAANIPGKTVSSRVPFRDLVALFEKINKLKGTEKKKQELKTFVDHWRKTHDELHGSDAATVTDSFFPALRLILPQHDKERQPYGMKEVFLAKQYINILGIPKDSADKLLHYRAPSVNAQGAGDFANVAYFELKNRCQKDESMNIEEVNKHLDNIANGNAEKKKDVVKRELQALIQNTSAREQKWLIRVILKELKLGLSEKSVFDVYHPDALKCYNVCNSLSKVCLMLRDLSVRIDDVDISIFTPFSPMLCQRAAIPEIENLIKNKPFYIETKVDGERMLIHKQGDEFKYYTRSSNEYTATFGKDSHAGTLTPYIAGCFPGIHSCILDGEMVVYDQGKDFALTKAKSIDVKNASTCDINGVHPCFIVFDVLLINGKKLSSVPLKERISRLERVFTPEPTRIELVKRQQGNSTDDVIKCLNAAIDNCEEGIVVKDPESLYKPNVRNGSGCLKIKPEYVDSLCEELDLIILGGSYGSGYRGEMISHFILGVAEPPEDPDERPSTFNSLCKVGSGFTIDELNELHTQLKPYWSRKQPSGVDTTQTSKDKPDVWIHPSKSKIVQVKATEIVTSNKFKAGMTLRFPRLEKVRDDKQWFECLDMKELRKLNAMAKGKLSYQHVSSDMAAQPPKKKRIVQRSEKPLAIPQQFQPADVSSVQQRTQFFQGKEFCVLNGSLTFSKKELERKIFENGGQFVQNPGDDTFCVVVHKVNARAQNITKRKIDVVKLDWLIKCLDRNELLPWQPQDMLSSSEATEQRFKMEYDEYGDSYYEDCTEESLREVFRKVDWSEDNTLTSEEIKEVEDRYFQDDRPLGLFRGYRFYVDRYSSVGDASTRILHSPLELVELELRFLGGSICEECDDTVTHVIMDCSDRSRLECFQRLNHSRERKQHIVDSQWVSDCTQEGKVLPERGYGVRQQASS